MPLIAPLLLLFAHSTPGSFLQFFAVAVFVIHSFLLIVSLFIRFIPPLDFLAVTSL
jgi:hypothetical protein